jgi:hypothetical protein
MDHEYNEIVIFVTNTLLDETRAEAPGHVAANQCCQLGNSGFWLVLSITITLDPCLGPVRRVFRAGMFCTCTRLAA